MKDHKFIQFLKSDRKVCVKIGILALGILIVCVEARTANTQTQQVAQLRGEMEQISTDLANAIAAHPVPQSLEKFTKAISIQKYELTGISVYQGTPQAIINDAIYKVGDKIDDYRVAEIQDNTVVLKNDISSELRQLFLYSDPVLIYLSKR